MTLTAFHIGIFLFKAIVYATLVLVVYANLPYGGYHWGASFALFHLLFGMMVWSYYKVALCDPGRIPKDWEPTRYTPKKRTGYPRYCKHCSAYKPARAYHCNDCKACTLKMDHHCPWVGNCVGHRTHKAFILWLGYVQLTGLFTVYMLIRHILYMDSIADHVWTLVLCVFLGLFAAQAVLGAGIMFFFQLSQLIWGNVSGMEYHVYERGQYMWRKRQKALGEKKERGSWVHVYDKGKMGNVREVFGRVWMWPFPVLSAEGELSSTGGLVYRKRDNLDESLEEDELRSAVIA